MGHIVNGGQISSSVIISGKVFFRSLANFANASIRLTFNSSDSSVKAINSVNSAWLMLSARLLFTNSPKRCCLRIVSAESLTVAIKMVSRFAQPRLADLERSLLAF